MKKLALVASSAAMAMAVSMPSQAEVSANAGFVSDYYFRGANLGDGGVYAGVDYESGGFFAGTWWIDDGTGGNDGLENDWYLGYGGGDDSFSWSVGYNNYQYTYTPDFEHEIVVGLGFGPASIELVKGADEDDAPAAGRDDSEPYTVVSASLELGAFSGTIGHYEQDDIDDSDYQWVQVSFSGELVEGIDASVSIGKAFIDGTDTDGFMVLDVSKSFDL